MAADVSALPTLTGRRQGRGLRRLRRFRGVPWISLAILLGMIVAAVGGPAVSPHDPNGINLSATFVPPIWIEGGSWSHVLGTDNLGRDILSRLIAGARISLVISLYAILLSGGIGGLVGMVSGYFGGFADAAIMRLVEIQMSIPPIALGLILAAALGPGPQTVVIVIVLTYWTWYARIVRGEILSLKARDYVRFARVAGVSTGAIFRRHLAPNILNTLLVLASLQVGQVILFEASLSFLGLGVQQPDVSWGLMLADARQYIQHAWWTITLPGVAILLTCLASNMTGDWLRDLFDPRMRQA
ncbi:ABC transporter permease [uncultured Albimonas sp.]|uniref:ABC transporter permease n=1 Tax=uncultured Albimonas sp. TaxID=1331701 RepID=UPI0030EDFC29|tara:strand:+ start:11376 stop:12275 length:900 start_codon:yes stop_codon:yes gene_type:complete